MLISSPVLKSMIRQTLFAVSDNDAKPIHTGTLFEIAGGLSGGIGGWLPSGMRTEPLNLNTSQPMKFILCAGKTLGEVLKLLSDDDVQVTLAVGRRHINFETNNYRVISRLLEGEFWIIRQRSLRRMPQRRACKPAALSIAWSVYLC